MTSLRPKSNIRHALTALLAIAACILAAAAARTYPGAHLTVDAPTPSAAPTTTPSAAVTVTNTPSLTAALPPAQAGAAIHITPATTAPTLTPLPQRNLEMAGAYSRAHQGLALMVLVGDEVIYEDYQGGFGPDKPQELFSGTKSFACAMAAAAVDDGILDLDERVAETIPEWNEDWRKAEITVRQLLNFTSGLHPGKAVLGEVAEVNKYELAVSLGAVHAPGERFAYGPSHLFVFGEVMRRKLAPLGEGPLGYLTRRVFDPIGMEIGGWRLDVANNPYMPYGAFVSARSWAKYGLLIKNGGMWQGEQLLRADVLAQCFRGSAANPAYGLTFWLNAPVSDEIIAREMLRTIFPRGGNYLLYEGGPPDLSAAVGVGNQRLYSIPSCDMVVVRFGWDDPTWRDGAFLARLLDGKEID